MNRLILYKYSSEEEAKIIELMLTLRGESFYLFNSLVNSYCNLECINPDEFNTEQFITLYMDTLKNLTSENLICIESYVIISNKELELIKDKLKGLNVPISIISLNIGCEEINDLPF